MARLAWLLLLPAACSTPKGEDAEPPPAKVTTEGRTPEADRKYKEAAARGEVKYGMRRDEVRTARGAPLRTKKTTYRKKPVTCWSYMDTDIFFDEDGYVVGWHGLTG